MELGELNLDCDPLSEGFGEVTMLFKEDGKRMAYKCETQTLSSGGDNSSTMGVLTTKTKPNSSNSEKMREMKMMAIVSEKIKCVPKNYKVSEEQKQGFFEKESAQLEKLKLTNGIPETFLSGAYIYQLREAQASDEEDDPSSTHHSTKPLKGLTSDRLQAKPKRVTLPTPKLEQALFQLFQEKSEYTIKDLEGLLNHPRNPLKVALKGMCNYNM